MLISGVSWLNDKFERMRLDLSSVNPQAFLSDLEGIHKDVEVPGYKSDDGNESEVELESGIWNFDAPVGSS